MTVPAEERCPRCGGVVFAGEAFCEACGRPLAKAACPTCGSAAYGPDGHCARCGTLAPGDHGGGETGGTAPAADHAGAAAGMSDRDGAGARGADGAGDHEHAGIEPGLPAHADDHTEGEAGGARERAGIEAGGAGAGGRPGIEEGGAGVSDRDHVEVEAGGAAGVSDRGLRHARNEDAMALAEVGGGIAAVVCDGVSTSPLPQEASRTAADAGLALLAERVAAGDDPEDATRTALERAAEAVAALASAPANAPACTYVSAYAAGGSVTVGWVGDSRAYWLADDGSRRLTSDDSWAAAMVARGVLSEDAAADHPNAHALIAWLGADAGAIDPHVTTFTPGGPGTLLLCSDGLWNYHPDATRLAELTPAGDPLAAARHLVRLALDSGGRDNITVVVIPLTQEHAP